MEAASRVATVKNCVECVFASVTSIDRIKRLVTLYCCAPVGDDSVYLEEVTDRHPPKWCPLPITITKEKDAISE